MNYYLQCSVQLIRQKILWWKLCRTRIKLHLTCNMWILISTVKSWEFREGLFWALYRTHWLCRKVEQDIIKAFVEKILPGSVNTLAVSKCSVIAFWRRFMSLDHFNIGFVMLFSITSRNLENEKAPHCFWADANGCNALRMILYGEHMDIWRLPSRYMQNN